MEFRETLLAAQRNQQQKSSSHSFYRVGFDPPKKEQRNKDRLSQNIMKFLAKKDEEEKQKQQEIQRKKEELHAMRDPKALRKIQKTLKVIKSANKSVLEDAVDRDHTALTLEGPDQPDQDDYGYESQEAAALYAKMMQKYSKMPEEPKFPVSKKVARKDLNGTLSRVKNALQHEDDPVPHKRKRRTENAERDTSPPQKYEPEKKREEKPEKPKIRKPAPPPLDFNQLLKLAEEKKSVPIEIAPKPTPKKQAEGEPERLMTKKQRREYEEEMARRQRRQERLDAEKGDRRSQRDDRPAEKDKKPETTGFGRIPKLGQKSENPKTYEKSKDKSAYDRDHERHFTDKDKGLKEKDRLRGDKDKAEKERLDKERLDRLKAERERIDREMEKLSRDRERLDKTKTKLECSKSSDKSIKDLDRAKVNARDQRARQDMKKSIDLKSQNTYRIDKNSNEKKFVIPNKNGDSKNVNGRVSQSRLPLKGSNEPQRSDKDRAMLAKQRETGKQLPESSRSALKKPEDRKSLPNSAKSEAPIKPKLSNSFDFDKHVNSLGKNGARPSGFKKDGTRQFPPGDVRRRPNAEDIKRKQKRRAIDSESEYDSEMDDFIDDGEENMDYSTHIKEIFGYDKFKYRDLDDDDDPMMESTFAQQQREEYISKKIGIMEDLEDMRMEAMEKKKSVKKRRRISDD